MRVRGYMIDIELTDDALRVEGTTKAARIALRAHEHGDGPLVIRRAEIAAVDLKRANALANGKLVVTTQDGAKHQLHYRKKSQDDFDALVAAVRA